MLELNTGLTGTEAIIAITDITTIINTAKDIIKNTGSIRGSTAGITINTLTIITTPTELITITGITGPITMVIMVEAIFS